MVNYKSFEVTNEQVADMPVKCEVTMDNVCYVSDDFVAVLSKNNGDAGIFLSTDALTLGMALKMVARSFVECMASCTKEEQAEISEILGSAFIGITDEEPTQEGSAHE